MIIAAVGAAASYITVEIIRGIRSSLASRKSRRDRDMDDARDALQAAKSADVAPGINPDGAFVLPTPGRAAPAQPQMGQGYAPRPQLVPDDNPQARAQREYETEERLRRLEHALWNPAHEGVG